MLKEKNLIEDFRPTTRYADGSEITLEAIEAAISECANEHGIPVAISHDQVALGGIFSMDTDNCLVLYHPDHEKDYFNFCIRLKKQGTYAFVSAQTMGHSKQLKKINQADATDRLADSSSSLTASLITKGLNNIGKNRRESKFAEESMYYSCLADILDEITQ